MNPISLLEKYYEENRGGFEIVLEHSSMVAGKALAIARGLSEPGIDLGFLEEAALLHDIGVSRTSKTPLSMYMAHKGVMVANIPLVPEADPPKELFSLPPERIVGLTIQPEKLINIRRERLRVLGLDVEVSNYAQWERVEEELSFARSVFRKAGCRTFDVTNRAIEETAQEILDYLRE